MGGRYRRVALVSTPVRCVVVLAGAASPASENDDMNDIAAVVPPEAAYSVEAGTLPGGDLK